MEINIGEIILEEEIDIGNTELDVVKEYPLLENLTVTPTGEQQIFNHPNSYGYDEVVVEAVESEILNITPTEETQRYKGLYGEVNVDKISTEEETPNLDFSNADVIEVKPSENSYLKKVTINKDEYLVPENIKSGVDIFGVTGTGEMANFEITDASYLFYDNARLDIMEKLLSMCKKPITTRYMFFGASDVLNLDLSKLDTSLVSNMQYMFQGCNKITSLDISHFNTSNVTDYSNFCNSCSSLKKLNVSGFTNEKTTDLSYFVARCSNLTEINLTNFLTPLVTTMYYMFWGCSSLASLNISSFDASKVRNIGNMFLNCNALTDLVFMNNLGKGYTQKTNNYSNYKLDLSGSKNLTHDSLMDVINKLYDLNLTYDVANGGTLYTQQLVLGSTNIAKLTTEEIAIATNKGWVVS